MIDQLSKQRRIRRLRVRSRGAGLSGASAGLVLSCGMLAFQATPLPLATAAHAAPVSSSPGGSSVTEDQKSGKPQMNGALERLRVLSRQEKTPAELDRNHTVDVTPTLSSGQQAAIGATLRECWTKDVNAPPRDETSIQMIITYDAHGVSRIAEIGPADQGRMGDPRFRALAERARRAVLDSRCSPLPIPPAALGRAGRLTFRFRP